MKISAIITEFNPLHLGHEYFIRKVRERSCPDYLVAVMSGDFVQRGEPALFSKYARAEAALYAGADLVLELPVRYALSSAGSFAAGAVNILNCLGCTDELWFGSESGNINDFLDLSAFLAHEPDSFRSLIAEALKGGFPYPAARAAAVEKLCGKEAAALLSGSNNVLGLEYCSSAVRSGASFSLHTIKREGSNYNDTDPGGTYPSAAAVRNEFSRGGLHAVSQLVPAYSYELMKKEPGGLAADDFSLLLRYRLLGESAESLSEYSEVTPDLARRIKNLENGFSSLSDFAMKIKTRNITYTHVSRALFSIILGMKKAAAAGPSAEVKASSDGPSVRPYIRILGMKDCGPLISRINDAGTARLFTRPAAVPEDEYRQDMYASDLYESVRSYRFRTPFVQECSRKFIKL